MDKIELKAEAREEALAELQQFVTNELDLEIGSLGTESLMEFILEKISPEIYNMAIRKAQSWYADRFAELNLDADSLLKES